MAVIILHPTEELKLIKFQKELISELFEEGRILYAARPLWIEIRGGFDRLNHRNNSIDHHNIYSVGLGEIKITNREIYIPVSIATTDKQIDSKLTLVSIYQGRNFSDEDIILISQKKQPVRQLKVFRLGIEKELSSVSKCISTSKWVKIK